MRILDFIVAIYVISCPFIMQIRESRVEHTDLIYFVFDVSDEIKIFICILSILLITLYGIISGSNKSYKRLILLLVICILLKAGSFLFDYYAPGISEFLWEIYRAPIEYIYQGLDIFVFAFYEIVFLLAFASGRFIFKSKNTEALHHTNFGNT